MQVNFKAFLVDMAGAGISVSEDELLCCICLDAFIEPVTLLCGHDFCWKCITKHWGYADRYQCPLCNECFSTIHGLQVNPAMSELTDQFRDLAQETARSCSSEGQVNAGKVLCDVCTKKAQKSCLVCLSSYCKTHVVFHQRFPGLRRHTLIDPVEGLEHRMCKKYQKVSQMLHKRFSN
ncbi:hypothetical protein CHARACLAT_027176 [Characodon lateralis]|uniref:RING-type domain-containing protein n=1 Tax=Characodon lateralis TaxID=208331 RepID=A0ABU7DWB3_9TELE|nr:hypothetical protein [Characodon lateralis]